MTITALYPWELGSPVMRSTDMEEKGRRGLLTAKGESLGIMGWVFTLAAWQSAHPVMNLRRKVDILLQFFFLIVPSYFSSILIVYLLGEVDAFTPILHIFSFALYPPFVSLTFPRT